MSDTESEPESQNNNPVPVFVPPSIEAREEQSITDAINQLQRLQLPDAETVLKDTTTHETISLASGQILTFLDFFHRASFGEEQICQRLAEFGELVSGTFLSILFEQRKVFHKIAAQTLESGSSGAVVCWVDSILSNLGDATVRIASGVSLDSLSPIFPGSAEIRAEDGLRAASQLPSNWHSVPGVIASDQASPAAKRLALRLAFAAFVLGPRLCRKNDTKTAHEMMGVLERCVNQTRATGFSAGFAGDQLALQERLNFAMVVSLFATTDRQNRKFADGAHLRPHSLGCLLNLLQYVIHPDDSVASLQLVNPPQELDPAIQLLLHWGDTVSWCWEVWDDHRVANAESIVLLTSMWLQSNEALLPNDAESQPDLEVSTASSIAILRVLHHAVLSLATALPSTGSAAVSTVVITRACFCTVKSMEYLLSRQNEDKSWIISGLCTRLLNLFVLLEPKSDSGLASDHILEALSMVDAKTLHSCFVHIQQDSNVRFAARLHERLVLVRNFVSTNPDCPWNARDLTFVRSALNFATIVWFSQTPGCLPKISVSQLLSAVVEFLLQNSSVELPTKILGEALLTALSAARNDPSLPDESRESLWRLAAGIPTELGIASSFAHYITTSGSLCSSLSCAEAWRYLGEVLMQILKHLYIGEQEPLALLVCPTICGGMMRLLQADSSACQYILSTPFTLNLCADLKSVCESTEGGEYLGFMRERLSTIGPQFLKLVRCKSRKAAPAEVSEAVRMRLVFYRMYGGPHVVFVAEP